jgi:hypothetical protein
MALLQGELRMSDGMGEDRTQTLINRYFAKFHSSSIRLPRRAGPKSSDPAKTKN